MPTPSPGGDARRFAELLRVAISWSGDAVAARCRGRKRRAEMGMHARGARRVRAQTGGACVWRGETAGAVRDDLFSRWRRSAAAGDLRTATTCASAACRPAYVEPALRRVAPGRRGPPRSRGAAEPRRGRAGPRAAATCASKTLAGRAADSPGEPKGARSPRRRGDVRELRSRARDGEASGPRWRGHPRRLSRHAGRVRGALWTLPSGPPRPHAKRRAGRSWFLPRPSAATGVVLAADARCFGWSRGTAALLRRGRDAPVMAESRTR